MELVKWMWKILQKIIVILTSDLSVTHYDPKQDIVVVADSSDAGICAVILHKFKDGKIKAKAHTSRTLLLAKKKKHGQIEKVVLVILFVIKYFH